MATTYSGIDAIGKIDEGLDWAIIGGGLTVVQECSSSRIRRSRRRPICGARNSASSPPVPVRSRPQGGHDRRFQARRHEGHRTAASGRTGVDQAVGKRRDRRHDQHQLAQSRGGSADGQVPRAVFAERLLEEEDRLSDRVGGAARGLEKLGRRGSDAGQELRRRRQGIRSGGWRSRKIWKPR